jgi:hypothetical protein
MTGFNSKRQAAQAKLDDAADTLSIVYQRGFADGKKAAQPEQEPVAQITPPGPITQYTIPTQRQWQGLTDEEIDQLLPDIVSGGSFTVISYGRAVARAIEAAHGIKEGT